jgi:hypothetical protein
LAVPGLELRALCLLGSCFLTRATPPALPFSSWSPHILQVTSLPRNILCFFPVPKGMTDSSSSSLRLPGIRTSPSAFCLHLLNPDNQVRCHPPNILFLSLLLLGSPLCPPAEAYPKHFHHPKAFLPSLALSVITSQAVITPACVGHFVPISFLLPCVWIILSSQHLTLPWPMSVESFSPHDRSSPLTCLRRSNVLGASDSHLQS